MATFSDFPTVGGRAYHVLMAQRFFILLV